MRKVFVIVIMALFVPDISAKAQASYGSTPERKEEPRCGSEGEVVADDRVDVPVTDTCFPDKPFLRCFVLS